MRAWVLLLFLLPAAAWADPKGLALAQRAHGLNQGYQGQRVEAELVIQDTEGKQRVAQMTQLWRESKDTTQSLIRFYSPPELAGTALLTIEGPKGDDRWLYLPQTKELKRISAETLASSFLGSEFSYEDLSFSIPERYEYTYVGPRAAPRPCEQVERRPKGISAYGRSIVCFDTEHGYPLDIQLFDRGDRPIKKITMNSYLQVDGHFRIAEVTIENLTNGRRSVFRAKKYRLGLALSAQQFTPEQLARPTP